MFVLLVVSTTFTIQFTITALDGQEIGFHVVWEIMQFLRLKIYVCMFLWVKVIKWQKKIVKKNSKK